MRTGKLISSQSLSLSLSLSLYIYMDWVQVTYGVTLSYVTSLNLSLLDANFNKSIIELNSIFNTLHACKISR